MKHLVFLLLLVALLLASCSSFSLPLPVEGDILYVRQEDGTFVPAPGDSIVKSTDFDPGAMTPVVSNYVGYGAVQMNFRATPPEPPPTYYFRLQAVIEPTVVPQNAPGAPGSDTPLLQGGTNWDERISFLPDGWGWFLYLAVVGVIFLFLARFAAREQEPFSLTFEISSLTASGPEAIVPLGVELTRPPTLGDFLKRLNYLEGLFGVNLTRLRDVLEEPVKSVVVKRVALTDQNLVQLLPGDQVFLNTALATLKVLIYEKTGFMPVRISVQGIQDPTGVLSSAGEGNALGREIKAVSDTSSLSPQEASIAVQSVKRSDALKGLGGITPTVQVADLEGGQSE